MREHSNASPKSFHFPVNMSAVLADVELWCPLAPTYGRRKADEYRGMHVVYDLHRCPYCACWHQFWADAGNGTESLIFAAPCMSQYVEEETPFLLRTVPIEGRPSDQELDLYFPLVDYALTADQSRCFRIVRHDNVLDRIVNELDPDWLPGEESFRSFVRGHKIVHLSLFDRVRRGTAGNSRQQPPVHLHKRKSVSRELRAAIWNKSQGRCYYCGLKTNPFENFAIDHLVPVADGGTNDPQNLVPACAACNGAKGAMSLASFRVKRGGGLFWFEIAITGGSVVLHGH